MFDLSKWGKREVKAALERGGYYDDFLSARYVGTNDYHQAMFDIAFVEEGVTEIGRVFVGVDKNGELIGEY